MTCSARNCGFICSSVIHGLVGEGYRLEEQCHYKSNYRLSLLFQSTFKKLALFPSVNFEFSGWVGRDFRLYFSLHAAAITMFFFYSVLANLHTKGNKN